MSKAHLGHFSFALFLIAISVEFAVAQTGSLSLTNSPMHIGRAYQSAISLSDGTILMIGGEQADSQVESFALPAGNFQQEGSLLVARTHQTATLFPSGPLSGKVLITGGIDSNGNVLSSAEIYDPASGTSQLIGGGMNSPRSDHRATLLQNGTVLITGGADAGGNTLSTAEIFDPGTGGFTPVGNMMQRPRSLHTATLLNSGQVLLVGGAIYSQHQACSTISPGNCSPTVWTDGDATAELYDPVSQQFTATGGMQAGRWDHSATLLSGSGQVLILGGGQHYGLGAYGPQGAPQGTWTTNALAEIYDPAASKFVPNGSIATGRLGHTATVLPSGVILVAGGQYDGVFYNPYPYLGTAVLNSTELFDPVNATSVTGPNLSAGRSHHTATALPNGAVLVAGGGNATADLYWPAGVPVAAGLNRVGEFGLSWGYLWNGYSGGPCNANWITSGVTFPNDFSLDQIRVPNHNNGYGGKLYVYQDSTSSVYAASTSANINFGDGVATFFFAGPSMPAGHTYYFDGDHVGPPGNDFSTGGYFNCGPSLWDFYAQAAAPAAPPVILSISPQLITQGATVSNFTVTGTGFAPNAALFVGGAITVSGTTVQSSTELTATVTATSEASTGCQKLAVTNPDGQTATLSCAIIVVSSTPPSASNLQVTVGNNQVALSWKPPFPYGAIGSYLIKAQSFDPVSKQFLDFGSVTISDPTQSSVVIDTSHPFSNGASPQNGTLYRFTIVSLAFDGTVGDSTVSSSGIPNPLPSWVGLSPVHPILFVHGINADARAWGNAKEYFQNSLGWKFGGNFNDPDGPTSDGTPSRVVLDLSEATKSQNGSFVVPADFYTLSFTDNLANAAGIVGQGNTLRDFVNSFWSAGQTFPKLTLFAWSMGGLASRSYLQNNQASAVNQIAQLITYGTPHKGVFTSDLIQQYNEVNNGNTFLDAVACIEAGYCPTVTEMQRFLGPTVNSRGLGDMTLGCGANAQTQSEFLTSLSTPPFGFLPGIAVTSIAGYNDTLVPDPEDVLGDFYGTRNGLNCPPLTTGASYVFTDGVVPIGSTQIGDLAPKAFMWTTGKDHLSEPTDIPTILCALSANCVQIAAHSPVDLQVLQSDGSLIANGASTIPGSGYDEYNDSPTHVTTIVTIPFPEPGPVNINAIPKSGSLPTDTYSISVTQNGNTQWLAQNVSVSSIPSSGYSFTPNSAPIALISGPAVVEATGPSGAVLSLRGAGTDPDGDSVSLRWYSALGDTNGSTLSAQFPLGSNRVVLVATDSKGATGTAEAVVTVNPAPQVISFAALPSQVTYGVAPILLVATGGPSGDPVVFTVTGPAVLSGNSLSITGTGRIVITANQAGHSWTLAASPVSQTIIVSPATLTVVAPNLTKTLDAPNPALSNVVYSGFEFSDGPGGLGGSLSCTTIATLNSPVGTYPITCSGQTSKNYAISYKPGTLKIMYATAGSICDGDLGHAILQPINGNGTSVFKRGSTVSAKFRVCDANGVSIGTPGVVATFLLAQVTAGTVTTVDEPVSSTTPDAAFRWGSTGQQWVFNMSTSNLAAGRTYGFTITLNDKSTIAFQFGLK